ncbi:MFS transporter [Leifsonia poae]|uniref:MFS transporter n=1 Tax=Leifsonia poae TaxID=110933 RepID=UPI003D69904C
MATTRIEPMTSLQLRVLVIAILSSFVAFLDGAVINVALPAISKELGGGLQLQQWVVDAYLVTLGSLILIAGSLSDVFGRKRVLYAGLIGFGVTSLLCAFAPSGVFLVLARALQGVAGALLVPSSLAIIISRFEGPAQAKAIGRWTAWTGIAMIAGPVVGGLFVDTLGWRWVFVINVIPIAITLVLLMTVHVADRGMGGRVDIAGAILGSLGLAGTVFALIEQGTFGWGSPRVWIPFVVGLLSLAAFFVVETRVKQPMLPLGLFRVHNFWVGNISTFFVYGALSFGPLVVTLFLQQVAGFSAIAAGFVFIPSTLCMLLLSGFFGGLAGRYGPRLFMAIGPVIAAAGFLWLLTMGTDVNYWTTLLPAVLLFGIGLSITVAPLTSAILGAIHPEQAGIASAVNNAVSRIAGLLAVAAIGMIIGGTLDEAGLHRAMVAGALLLLIGGVVSGIGIRNGVPAAEKVQTVTD